MQKELKEALHILNELPESGVYVIPVRLDNSNILYDLKKIQSFDLFPNWEIGIERIAWGISK